MKKKLLSIALIFAFCFTLYAPVSEAATVYKLGSRGTGVVQLQQKLISLGYLNDRADGYFGSKTRSAVIAFQRSSGLTADGIAGPATLVKLYGSAPAQPTSPAPAPTPSPSPQPSYSSSPLTVTLKYGNRGSQVGILQARLNELGFNCGRVDGIFGTGVLNAVKAFQRSRGLTADGVVGPASRAALYPPAPPVPQPQPTPQPDPVPEPQPDPAPAPQPEPTPSEPSYSTPPITTVLKYGSRGAEVGILQARLNELGFNCGAVDNEFGPAVLSAVKAFQNSKGLTADGIVGPATIAALFPTTPQPQPQPSPVFQQFHGTPGSLSGKTVILDAGHGGDDNGASRSGIYEKNLALDTALRTKRVLEEAGAKVILTRGEDKSISLFYRSAVANNYILEVEISRLTKEISDLTSLKSDKETGRVQKEGVRAEKLDAVNMYKLQVPSKEAELDLVNAELTVLALELTAAVSDLETATLTYNKALENYTNLDGTLKAVEAEIISLKNQLAIETDVLKKAEIEVAIAEKEAVKADLTVELETALTGRDAAKAIVDAKQSTVSEVQGQIGSRNEVAEALELVISKLNEDIKTNEDVIISIDAELEALAMEIPALGEQIVGKEQELNTVTNLKNQVMQFINDPTYGSRTGIFRTNSDLSTSLISVNDDLKRIFDITREKYEDSVIFISIHNNSTGDDSQTYASGVRIYQMDSSTGSVAGKQYYSDYNDSKRLSFAQSLLTQLNSTTNFASNLTSTNKDNFSVLRENNLISALVELGFINNPNDRALLIQEQTREDAAAGIYKGIVEYFK